MELVNYVSELLSVSLIAIFMAISPGADFVMVTRNSIFHGRSSGLYSSLGISLAIWIHVAYSIAGLALVISNSFVIFSIIKYLGSAYLIYIGCKTFRSKSNLDINDKPLQENITKFAAFKIGFVTNALNPKTTLFFLSIFTQVVDITTPVWVQLIYGAVISLAHLVWFCFVSILLSQPVFIQKFNEYKSAIEKIVGGVLIGFGLKVATASAG